MKSAIYSVFLLAFLVCTCHGQQPEAVRNSLPQPGQIATPSLFPSVPSPDLTSADIGSPEMQSTTPAKSTLAADKHEQRVRRLWYGTIAMMLAGNAADAMTSWHKQEANGLLASTNGTFGGKAIGIKVGISAAILTPQLLLRHHPELRKEFIIGNLIDAALFGGTAIHNAGISKP
jgi:hypothetical protein